MSIRPIDMQGMVRNSTHNQLNSNVNQQHSRYADVKAHQQVLDQQAEALTQKAEKPAEEKKQLDKDGSNKEKQERRNNRKKREVEATADTNDVKSSKNATKKSGRSMFDVSI